MVEVVGDGMETNDPAVPSWIDALVDALTHDDDFRRMFERTPGKAAHSLGVPFDEFRSLMAAAASTSPDAAGSADEADPAGERARPLRSPTGWAAAYARVVAAMHPT